MALHIEIPGRTPLDIEHVLLDYNGTIATDGAILPEVAERLRELAALAHVCVLTADTHGTARAQCEPLGLEVYTFPQAGAAVCKKQYAESLQGGVVAMGNGFNDQDMFGVADLSVMVLDTEGAWPGLFSHADVVVHSAADALDLFLKPQRLRATLRS